MSVRPKLLLDVPSRKPALGFGRTARALAEIIMESSPQFAIGIFGGWGSGKTTLMRAIEERLDSSRVVSVQFSAWRYEKEEHLIVPLLDTIREALVVWGDEHRTDEGEAAKKTAATIGRVTRSILAGLSLRVGVPHAIELSFDANKALEASREVRRKELDARVPRSFYHASFLALSEAFRAFVGEAADRRIVVFIDDLDRCLPESALQVLESMKLFFDLEGFVFVVGLDQDVVEHVIDLKYGPSRATTSGDRLTASRVSGAEYVKKIFQLPYRLAPVARDQLEEFLDAAYLEAGLPEEQFLELQRVGRHLHYFVGDSSVNPREIKRYVNAYIVQRWINPHLNRDALLTLQTIAFRPDWHAVQDAILAYGQLFINALRDRTLRGLDPDLERAIPDGFLDYIETYEPGNALLKCEDIERYVHSGEAVRSTQDPRLLAAIRNLGQARGYLVDATDFQVGGAARTNEQRKEGLRAAHQAISRVLIEIEFAPGGAEVKARISRDILAYQEVSTRLLNSDDPIEAHEKDLEELKTFASSISERLFRLYRTGESPYGIR